MIREDIKQKLINEDLDKLFLPHRDGIDQANYRVGDINNEIIAWNPDTNIFMDYFYDDYPDIIWFELSLVYNEGNGYKINRNGEVLGPSGRIIAKLYDAWGYINYKIHVSKNKKAHILMAKMFVPNIDPDNKIFVDHINRDKNNILPTNLRWVTSKENANNLYRPKHTDRVSNAIFRAYSDKERTHLVKEYFGAESLEAAYPNRNNVIYTIQDSIKGRISKGKKNNGKRLFYSFEKLYWEIEAVDPQLTEYFEMIGKTIDEIDESLWTRHYSGDYLIHPLGLVRSTHKAGDKGITVGAITYLNGRHPERKFGGNRVHRLVAEVFLNGNKPIEKGLVVDHINTNSLDNRAENLRICTTKENMNNENTIKKLKENPSHTRKVVGPDGTIYNTINSAAKAAGILPTSMYRKLSGRRPSGGYKYYDENDQNNNNNS